MNYCYVCTARDYDSVEKPIYTTCTRNCGIKRGKFSIKEYCKRVRILRTYLISRISFCDSRIREMLNNPLYVPSLDDEFIIINVTFIIKYCHKIAILDDEAYYCSIKPEIQK